MRSLEVMESDPRRDDTGFIGPHRCPCCGYTCRHEYLKEMPKDRKNRGPTEAAKLLMAQVDEMAKAGMKVPEIAEEFDVRPATLRRRLLYNGYDMSKIKVKKHVDTFTREFKELELQGLSLRQIAQAMGMRYDYVKDKSLSLGLREPIEYDQRRRR